MTEVDAPREGQRIELEGLLRGRYIVLKPRAITMGFIEDLQEGTSRKILDTLAGVLVGGNLEAGTDRNGLRQLTPPEFTSLCNAVASSVELPKGTRTSS
jgi:hypothetical protein